MNSIRLANALYPLSLSIMGLGIIFRILTLFV
jgi:hypothetical protein